MLCRNGETFPNTHEHQTVAEARRCWAGSFKTPAPTAPLAASPAPPPVTVSPSTVTARVRMVSDRQLQYVENYGGDLEYAKTLSYDDAFQYVHNLIEADREARRAAKAKPDKRLELIKGMIDLIPDGYYAAAKEGEGGHIDFLRISRPERGKFRGALKIQTQHSERWENAMILWPSGNWSVYKWSTIEPVMLVLSDHHGCAKRYAIEIQSCMVCNTKLTDDRSRHYLIGPICDKKSQWAWVIEEVDEKNAGLSYEELVARGLPTRVWQERR